MASTPMAEGGKAIGNFSVAFFIRGIKVRGLNQKLFMHNKFIFNSRKIDQSVYNGIIAFAA
jgi:hypothetical protein